MAVPRLSDGQKQELVDRFRAGTGTQELAAAYACSPNTVIRVVKAAIEPALYEELKRQRGRRSPSAGEGGTQDSSPATPPLHSPPLPTAPIASTPAEAAPPDGANLGDALAGAIEAADAEDESEDQGRALAIDDADDFEDYEDDEESGDEDGDDDPADEALSAFPEHSFVEVPISLVDSLEQPLTAPRPWCIEELPSSAYMLVDKTVELQARPLAEIPELGRLEAEELTLQALVLYSNPRQAKRQCGRTQRVIKVPDVAVLERTAPYLLRQGIRRIVVEGALYALPEA